MPASAVNHEHPGRHPTGLEAVAKGMRSGSSVCCERDGWKSQNGLGDDHGAGPRS